MAARLSVIVPFFGVEAYIADCLRSIARQTFDDFEVVLIDDGSLDGSAAIAHDFATRDRRFRVIAQENRGLGLARNAGVEQSVGEFLTFVDSDDIVPRHAFEIMVGTLDQTGSSFAAGDVRRFDAFGVRESLLHRGPFARERLATHVREFPALAVDRIMCNKVYRRRFWDEFGYEFPAIRYEDYPIALQSHLDAVTVDCVPSSIYLWRFRESGGSITDDSHEYSNLVDRVASAEMVIDLVSRRAQELEARVHRHLLQVDLLPLLQAFRTAPEAEEQSFVTLGRRLVSRLDGTALESARPFDRLQIYALRSGDVTALRELAAYRHDCDADSGVRARRRWLTPWVWDYHVPALTDRPRRARRRAPRLHKGEPTLRTTVTDVRWQGSSVAVRGTTEIRHLQGRRRPRLRLALTRGGVEIPCDHVAHFTPPESCGNHGVVGFEVHIDGTTFASLPYSADALQVSIDFAVGAIRRRGLLGGMRPGSPEYAQGAWVRDGLWVQPRQDPRGGLAFDLLEDPACLTSATVSDGTFFLTGTLPRSVDASGLLLTGPEWGDATTANLDLRSDGAKFLFTGQLPLIDVVADFDSDDPYAEPMTRIVQLAGVEAPNSALLPTGLDRAVGGVHESLQVLLTRTQSNAAAFSVSPIRFVAEEITANSTASRPQVVVSGRLGGVRAAQTFVWRPLSATTNEPADVLCACSTSGTKWLAVVDADDLMQQPRRAYATSGFAAPKIYTLFAIADDGRAEAVHVDGFLSSQLPVEIQRPGRTARIVPESALLRVVVTG